MKPSDTSCVLFIYLFIFGHETQLVGSYFPNQGLNLHHPALEVQNLNHWTARGVPNTLCSCFPTSKLSEPYYLGVLYT